MIKDLLIVFLGSGIGGATRFGISKLTALYAIGSFPLGTFAVNVIGCFLIGIINGLAANTQIINAELKLLLAVGFCGGFTTFSSFMNENMLLIRSDEVFLTAIYTGTSLVCGMLALWIGYTIVK